MTRFSLILGIFGAVVFAVLSLSGLVGKDAPKATYAVSVTPVVQEEIKSEVRAIGNLTSSQKREIQGKEVMSISKVYVREGAFVKRGQPLAEIAKSQFMEELLSRYKDAQIESETSKDALTATKELLERKAVPAKQFQETEIRIKKAEAAVSRIASEIQTARQSLSLAEQAEEPPFLMVSPQDGTIIKLHLTEGRFIQPKMEESLVVIANLNQLEVVAEIDPIDILKVKVGQQVVFPISEEGTLLVGRVKTIAQEVTGTTDTSPQFGPGASRTTIRVVSQMRVPILPKGIKLGLIGELRILTGLRKNALVIPVDAILSAGPNRFVYVVEKDRARKRDVKIGMVNQQNAEVLHGVVLGEKIVTRGQFLLHDQATIVIAQGGS